MILTNQRFIIEDVDGTELIKKLERIGRTAYKSEDKITESSAEEFIKKIIKLGHESVLEHASLTVRVICDRGVSHEIVRHRIASYTQESTRYCNYSNEKFNNQITVIVPPLQDDKAFDVWKDAMLTAEKAYFKLIELGVAPQLARNVLPTSVKTEIVMTLNIRAWRHFFRLRTATRAHPQIRDLANSILDAFKISTFHILFGDL